MLVRCLRAFSWLFGPVWEWVEAQIIHDLRMMGRRRIHLVAFPTAERYRANPQPASRFRLEEFQLETAAPELTANCGRLFWDLNTPIAGW